MNDKIRCAIVGLGRIGSSLEDDKLREKPASHAGAVAENVNCILVGGADINEEARIAFSERWKINDVFETTEDMIIQTKPQLFHIATHPDSHLEYVKLGIKYEIPVIICEKPLAPSLKEAKKIVKLIEKSETKLVLNHERRYSRDYVYVKEQIKKKVYGRLISLHARLYMGKNSTPQKSLYHDGTHMIDIIRYLTEGNWSRVKVFGNVKKKGQNLIIVSKLGQADVVFEIGGQRDAIVFELDLSFERGRIRIGNGLYEEYESKMSPYYEKMRSLIQRKDIEFKRTEYFKGMLEDAVSLILKKKQEPLSKAIDGYEVIKTIEKIIRKSN